ncbi:NADH-ubiquinone oxidoreductase chain 5 [Bienertia sinuspersici]
MVKFDTTQSSRGDFLMVMNDNNGSHKLTIPTFSPITGVFVEERPPLYYPPNLENWMTGETKPILCSSHHEACTEVKSLDTLHGPKKYSTTSLPQVVKDFSALGTSKPWNNSVHEPFVILGIPEEHRMDTYLAAFLTCWICAFVLPLKDLASIYKGLGELSNSFTPGKQVEHFPAHYVYTWFARYFRSHHINWVIIAPNDTTSVKYVDDSMQSQQAIDFFLSVRSCLLTLRYDNNCIAEPYSPHRFSRQFGFYQDVPGKLKPPPEKVTRQYLYSLFQTSVRFGTHFSFVIPARGLKMNLRVTDSYTSWWKSIYSLSINSLNLPSPPKSSEGRRSKSQKRKADNTPPHDKDAKATRDSYRKGPLKIRLTRGSSTYSPKEPAMQSTKGDQSRSPSQSYKDGRSSKDKDRTVLQDMFDGTDSCGETLSDEEQKANFDIVAELNACNNSFGAIDEDLLAAEATLLYYMPLGFLVKQMKTKLLYTPLINISALDPELKELFGYIISKYIDVASLLEPKELKLLEKKESELSSALATSKDSLAKHDATVKDLTISHTSLEKDIIAAKESATKRQEAEENFQNACASLESLQWEP